MQFTKENANRIMVKENSTELWYGYWERDCNNREQFYGTYIAIVNDPSKCYTKGLEAMVWYTDCDGIGNDVFQKIDGKWTAKRSGMTEEQEKRLEAIIETVKATTTIGKSEKDATAEKLIALGGKRWTKNVADRVYFNEDAIEEIFNITYSVSNSGWKSNIKIDGEPISGCKYRETYGNIDKFYYDINDGHFHWYGETGGAAEELARTIRAKMN